MIKGLGMRRYAYAELPEVWERTNSQERSCEREAEMEVQRMRSAIYAVDATRTTAGEEADVGFAVLPRCVVQCHRRDLQGGNEFSVALGKGVRKTALREAGTEWPDDRYGIGRAMALPGEKTQKLWIWKAMDSNTGELLDWECGDRSKGTLKRMLNRLKIWDVQFYCTDEWEAYRSL